MWKKVVVVLSAPVAVLIVMRLFNINTWNFFLFLVVVSYAITAFTNWFHYDTLLVFVVARAVCVDDEPLLGEDSQLDIGSRRDLRSRYRAAPTSASVTAAARG